MDKEEATEWHGYTMMPHQVKPAMVMACADAPRGLLLFYSVGSGKTLAALFTACALGSYWKTLPGGESSQPQVLIIAPAKVAREVWEPQIKALCLPTSRFLDMSFDEARLRKQKILDNLSLLDPVLSTQKERENHPRDVGADVRGKTHTLLIVDEAHTLRNSDSATFRAVFAIASLVDRVLLLTATPMVNTVTDMQSLLRLLANDARVKVADKEFVDHEKLEPRRLRAFASLFTGRVLTHHVPLSSEHFPEVDYVTHQVPMYRLQADRYRDFEDQMLTPAMKQLLREGIVSNRLNSFLVRTRAISNTVGRYALPEEGDKPEDSAKFRGIRKSLLEEPKPAVVYSFYLKNGVLPLRDFIDSTTELRTAVISGESSVSEVRRVLKAFNVERTVDVLFLTSAVRQGITLLRARSIHVMESGWNESLQTQVIGRVARFNSHSDLPPEERHVQVHYWITTLRGEVTADQYVHEVAERKANLIAKFEEVISHLRPPRICPLPVRQATAEVMRRCDQRMMSAPGCQQRQPIHEDDVRAQVETEAK